MHKKCICIKSFEYDLSYIILVFEKNKIYNYQIIKDIYWFSFENNWYPILSIYYEYFVDIVEYRKKKLERIL